MDKKSFSLSLIKEIFSELFCEDNITSEEVDSVLHSGYMYSIGDNKKPENTNTRQVKIYTGRSGAELYISICRKEQMPEWLIASSITVQTDLGPYTLTELIKNKRANGTE